jgi:hypothetical protein
MTAEQFVYWLKGYISNTATLTESDLRVIKQQLTEVRSNNMGGKQLLVEQPNYTSTSTGDVAPGHGAC